MASSVRFQRGVNKWGARLIPVLLVGIVGYATWIVVALLAADSLLHPISPNPTRTGAGIAIIVVYVFVLLLVAVNYFRLIQVVVTNSGYVEKPVANTAATGALSENGHAFSEKPEGDAYLLTDGVNPSQRAGFLDRTAVLTGRIPAPPGLDHYYLREAYECDIDGLPRWCSRCLTWKPDRSHHCSEIGHCVYKMDHFCPWAGGVVSDTNFKFFIQFCLSGCIYCIFVLISTAYFLAKLDHQSDLGRVNFIILIALAAMFFLFTFGMAINSINFAFLNTTTVDNLSRRTRIYSIAVLLRDAEVPNGATPWGSRFTTITYPLGGSQIPSQETSQEAQGDAKLPAVATMKPRTFAILTTPPGANPYDLSSIFQNFRSVMGDHWYDWFLPLRNSPCHARRVEQQNTLRYEHGIHTGKSLYEFGPVLRRMKQEAGIGSLPVDNTHSGNG